MTSLLIVIIVISPQNDQYFIGPINIAHPQNIYICIINWPFFSRKRRNVLKYQRSSFMCPLFTESLFDLFFGATDAGCSAPDGPARSYTTWSRSCIRASYLDQKGVVSHFPAWGFGHNAASVAKVFTTQTDIFVLVVIHNGTECTWAKSSFPPICVTGMQ